MQLIFSPHRSVSSKPSFRYRVAGRELVTDRPVAALQGLRSGRGAHGSATNRGNAGRAVVAGTPHLVYDGPGWLGGYERRVVSWAGSDGYEITVEIAEEQTARFLVDPSGNTITCTSIAAPGQRQLIEEAAMGPALAVALALHDVFCLHASAALAPQGVVVFLGDSAAGKSTLASYLASQQGPGWPLVADDMLALEWREDSLVAHTDFPQPRLAPHAQPGRLVTSPQPLAALVCLQPESPPAAGRATVSAATLPPSEAVHVLASQTLALRLFDRPLTVGHLTFVSQLVSSIGVVSLRYPHTAVSLPATQNVLESQVLRHAGTAAAK
jgi:hypothetical protein